VSLSTTRRSTVTRLRERARTDRDDLYAVLDAGLVCHLGLVRDGAPVVLPTGYGRIDDTVYVHGSTGAGWLRIADGAPVCLTVTHVDGIVYARSVFHHSMNYRSAVVIGSPRAVTDAGERERALRLLVDHLVPGRADTLRAHTRKELAATEVLAVSLHEASVKVRTGDPIDDEADLGTGVWAGVLPLRVTADPARPSADCDPDLAVPADVVARAQTSIRSASSS